MDSQINAMDLNTSVIQSKVEELYNNESFEIPNLREKSPVEQDDSTFLFNDIKKEFPGYQFDLEFVEGKLEYKEIPRIVYDNKEKRYFFEIKRKIKFSKNVEFGSLQLSIKVSFFIIILRSLLLGTLISTIVLIPLMIFLSRRIITPIIDISRGAKEIAEGTLGIQVKHNSNDELGELSDSFNYMSKELSKIKEVRDDLLATISHELRSPLSRISGYTELLLDLKFNKKEQDLYYKSILQEIELLNNMVAEIIEISRLEMDKETLFLEKIDFGFFLEMIEEDLKISTKINNVKLNFKYKYGIFCRIDVEKIKRVVVNAIQNSMNAKAKNIDIFATEENNKINVLIKDDGIGIKEKHLELVFEKFYRVDKSRDRKTGGFGLGLAICRGIIKEHKGKIYFAKVDKGSELHIELPIIEDSAGLNGQQNNN